MPGRLFPLQAEPGSFTVVKETPKTRVKAYKPKGNFPFFKLPSELRNHIYEYAIFVPESVAPNGTVDLHPWTQRVVAPRLRLLRTCRKIYEEAYPVFYGRQPIRIFPTHPGTLNSKKPLLMQLPKHYRRTIQTLELRLGPGWGKPPRCQKLTPRLGLKDCTAVHKLKVFVEIDPSGDIFKGFRISDDFYTAFASGLLDGVLQQCPSIEVIEFDAYPSVKKKDALMTALLAQAMATDKRITYGAERGWRLDKEPDPCELQGLENALAVVHV